LPCLDRNIQTRVSNFIVAVALGCFGNAICLSGWPLLHVALSGESIRRILLCCASLLIVVLFDVDLFVTARAGAFLILAVVCFTQVLLLLDDI